MIIGAHIMLQSRDDKADQSFLKEVMKLGSVDAGEGFFIYGLPPAELAVHESDKNDVHEILLMCDDIEAFAADMKTRGIDCTPPANRGWGTLAQITLPGGGKLGVYQPHHKRPKAAAAAAKKTKKKSPARKSVKKAAKKAAKTVAKKAAKKKKAKKR
jgi:hypothetical protein